jgi:DNA ligase 1
LTDVLELPRLYKKTSSGAIQTWKIEAEGNEITTVYGLELGKKQVAREVISVGKNVGKANETTPEQQAQAEARSQWEKKLKKGYATSSEDAQADKIDTNMITGGVDPMLAQSYEKHSAKITYPAFVQPKLDGHRCIAIIQDGKCTLWSRTRKPITGVPHIARALEAAYPNKTIVLDGELYNHDYREKFEELTSYIRQVVPKPGHEVVQYWVYDIVSDDPFSIRALLLADLGLGQTGGVVIDVPTATAQNEEEMINIFGIYLDAGFEGLMVRNSKGRYVGKRSYDLQKVKMMQDAEFEIVDVVTGRGKMEGLAIFRCVTEDGREFGVKMKGALDDLRKYLDHKDDYIGQKLTVQYQKLSAEGTPIFPVGLRIRRDV